MGSRLHSPSVLIVPATGTRPIRCSPHLPVLITLKGLHSTTVLGVPMRDRDRRTQSTPLCRWKPRGHPYSPRHSDHLHQTPREASQRSWFLRGILERMYHIDLHEGLSAASQPPS